MQFAEGEGEVVVLEGDFGGEDGLAGGVVRGYELGHGWLVWGLGCWVNCLG